MTWLKTNPSRESEYHQLGSSQQSFNRPAQQSFPHCPTVALTAAVEGSVTVAPAVTLTPVGPEQIQTSSSCAPAPVCLSHITLLNLGSQCHFRSRQCACGLISALVCPRPGAPAEIIPRLKMRLYRLLHVHGMDVRSKPGHSHWNFRFIPTHLCA